MRVYHELLLFYESLWNFDNSSNMISVFAMGEDTYHMYRVEQKMSEDVIPDTLLDCYLICPFRLLYILLPRKMHIAFSIGFEVDSSEI